LVAAVIRVHLNAEDLLRVRFASHPAPLIELGHALAALHRSDPVFTGWRHRARAQLPLPARPLLNLIPGSATGPLFLDPVSTSVEEGLQLVQQAPPAFITAELQRVTGTARPPSWVRMLAEQDRQSWHDLIGALRLAHQRLIASHSPHVWGGFRSERAWRGRLMAELGVQGALATLHPAIGWDATVLQIQTPKELDFYPRGAGVTLLPSIFWTGRPQIGHHPDGSVVIVYPALTPLPILQQASSDHSDPLGALLGRTRAAVLRLTAGERTTTGLASELAISAATVSGHTKALRAAGLIVTTRAGKAVQHSVTPLGSMLLDNAASSSGARQPGQTAPGCNPSSPEEQPSPGSSATCGCPPWSLE
jgi:DNA-binding transcriptional ArsR family regulator